MCFTFGRAVMCLLPEVTANSDIFLKLDFFNTFKSKRSCPFSQLIQRTLGSYFCLKLYTENFSYCTVTRCFQNFISVKGIPVFWVMALVCALLLKVRLIVMYSLTHLSMKIICLPEKIQSLRTSSSDSLYVLCIFWTKFRMIMLL